jgi:hypothetical protein
MQAKDYYEIFEKITHELNSIKVFSEDQKIEII